ncbi:hypothetical protein [Streptomyces sp. N50]|uniref:hypothetical protein n=1 Tax=Streptomyces sp. N50 TaxID=3081765 RepID=UPI002961F98B|nr:hypothetical protein [Streptomyces sp. N50]WOX09179.1 hypothetical protein R2B38_09895 [Streptomyces sp. N50]
MKYLILGALLGLLLVFPQLLAVVVAIVAAVLGKPVLVAFGLGLAAGVRSRRLRRWAR